MEESSIEGYPKYASRFASFRVVEAIVRNSKGEEKTLLETRIDALGNENYFTVVHGHPIHSNSIQELVSSIPSLISLEIERSIDIIWNGQTRKAKLTEVFQSSSTSKSNESIEIRLRLTIDDHIYTTEACDTLMDAIWDLQEKVEPESELWVKTCYHCIFSGHALNYLVGDREFWCYRDVPDALAEIRAKRKAASQSSRFAGNFFVNAFHTCAAWDLSKTD